MDLSEAYKKALPMYSGRLEHTFVVLKDDTAPEKGEGQTTGSNAEPVGQKRPAPDNEEGKSKRMAL